MSSTRPQPEWKLSSLRRAAAAARFSVQTKKTDSSFKLRVQANGQFSRMKFPILKVPSLKKWSIWWSVFGKENSRRTMYFTSQGTAVYCSWIVNVLQTRASIFNLAIRSTMLGVTWFTRPSLKLLTSLNLLWLKLCQVIYTRAVVPRSKTNTSKLFRNWLHN